MRLDGTTLKQPTVPSSTNFAHPSAPASSQSSVKSTVKMTGVKPTAVRFATQTATVQTDQAVAVAKPASSWGQVALPQTGNSSSLLSIILGVFTGSLTLFGLRKRHS
ncbi:LPXTG cell wall anchor domain-containing protein [Limosilactobacillus pontis]|uniref:LPXTG cell wall anchor domain-containing protein n=2 Tax=Limosilactobacillus pontis TaxID=35787 RepID=A0ABU7STZ8_9LACO